MPSQDALDGHVEVLAKIDVARCRAADAADYNRIMKKIGWDNTEAFNRKLQCLIFGLDGLLKAFVHGQQRVAVIARLLRAAQRSHPPAVGD
mmetsp:Transcript_78955/g.154882  ORF Transcript_78955/g.154882 Transcript_78955/m.154882 type:complete len:91 (+) Transcript_78955:1-273(+)